MQYRFKNFFSTWLYTFTAELEILLLHACKQFFIHWNKSICFSLLFSLSLREAFKRKQGLRQTRKLRQYTNWNINIQICKLAEASNIKNWSVQLVHPADMSSWSVQLVCSAGLSSWSIQLVLLADPFTHCILHVFFYILHPTCCILHIASYMLHLTHCILRIAS